MAGSLHVVGANLRRGRDAMVGAWRSLDTFVHNLRAAIDVPEYARDLDTPERLLDYIRHARHDVALVAYGIGGDGAREEADSIFHNADLPVPLASTVKIVPLAAYGWAVAHGHLDPNAQIAVGDWERFYLPDTDGGAHREALKHLGLTIRRDGFTREPRTPIAIDQIVGAMIRHSDNAATDWLLAHLGPSAVAEAIGRAGLGDHGPVRSLVGSMLAWQNHEIPYPDGERITELASASPEQQSAEIDRLASMYQRGPWRHAELRWRRHAPSLRAEYLAHAASALTPWGTARGYVRMAADVIGGTCLSPEVAAIMRRHLEWPMSHARVRERFETLGGKGGSLPGILTEVAFLVPRTGPRAGQARVVVLFMRRMPIGAWIELTGSFVHQRFAIRLATDPEFAEQVRSALAE